MAHARACWLIKATNRHSENVILNDFPPLQWLRERGSILHYTYIACLFKTRVCGVRLLLIAYCLRSISLYRTNNVITKLLYIAWTWCNLPKRSSTVFLPPQHAITLRYVVITCLRSRCLGAVGKSVVVVFPCGAISFTLWQGQT
jgi:hypothetical protein